MTYYGAEKVLPHYNVMGVAKAALEASTRYLAADLGPSGIRINAISAGPVRTLSAHGIAGFKMMYGAFAEVAPLRSHITIEDVAGTAVYLASPLSGQTTGEVIYVDAASTSWAAGRGVGGHGISAAAWASAGREPRGDQSVEPDSSKRIRRQVASASATTIRIADRVRAVVGESRAASVWSW